MLGLCLVLFTEAAHAAPGLIAGTVVDRNGDPLARAIVSLSPGNVELVTDRDGKFAIDYLRDETGERIKLAKKTTYQIEFFKPGFHTVTTKIDYKHGEFVLADSVTMVEESIKVSEISENLDAGTGHTQSTGVSLEEPE
jgi:hypothetical protein